MDKEKINSALVTAIITCMTDAERPFIREAIGSVVAQTVPCVMRIYVETGNRWIDEVARDFPALVVRRIPLQPLGVVRNIGIAEAETPFVAFLDGDDAWMPQKTEIQLKEFTDPHLQLVGADHVLIHEDGTVFAYGLAKYLPMPSTWLVRRAFIEQFPFLDLKIGEDGEWWVRTAGAGVRRRIAKFLVRYRVRGASLSSTTFSKRRKLLLATASRITPLCYGIKLGSWLLNRAYASTEYCWHPSWRR